MALLLGVAATNIVGNPFAKTTSALTKKLLQISVVGLGFGMNVSEAIAASSKGLLLTVITLASALLFGWLVGRWLKVDQKINTLITSGTAICGGSAIAAMSPVVGAEPKQTSVALGTVFLLNALALLLFPIIGHLLHLDQQQFGIWAAVAIHDTSSVVGAASKYGAEALQIATTVKLARALWIIPLTIIASFIYRGQSRKIKFPLFILWFVVAIVLNTYVAPLQSLSPFLVKLAKALLVLCLFLIGSGLNRKMLATVGFRPLLLGIAVWVLLSVLSLVFVMNLI